VGKRSRKRAALSSPASRRAALSSAAGVDQPVPADAGERPAAPWGRFPVSELAILAGVVLLVAGLAGGGQTLGLAGLALIVLATLEFAAREHVTGFRSHAALLALVPAALVHALAAVLLHARAHPLLFVADAAVFAVGAFWLTVGFRRASRRRAPARRA
jgi:hypothetical protein